MFKFVRSNSYQEARENAIKTLKELSPMEDGKVELEEGKYLDTITRGEVKIEYKTISDKGTGNTAYLSPLALNDPNDKQCPYYWYLDTSNSLEVGNRLYPYRDLGGLPELAVAGETKLSVTKPPEPITATEANTWGKAVEILHYFAFRIGIPNYDNQCSQERDKDNPFADFEPFGFSGEDWDLSTFRGIPIPILEDIDGKKIKSYSDYDKAMDKFFDLFGWEEPGEEVEEQTEEEDEIEEPTEEEIKRHEKFISENYLTARAMYFSLWVRYEFQRTERYSTLQDCLKEYKAFGLTKADVASYEKLNGYTIEEEAIFRYGLSLHSNVTGVKTIREIAQYIKAPIELVSKANEKRQSYKFL